MLELCSTFSNLKKNAQSFVAVTLRRAIWNWIETYPNEFVKLCQSQRRMEGGPDTLFDLCMPLADTLRRKAVLWPLQTMLLVLCPDILLSSAVSDSKGTPSRKVSKEIYVVQHMNKGYSFAF